MFMISRNKIPSKFIFYSFLLLNINLSITRPPVNTIINIENDNNGPFNKPVSTAFTADGLKAYTVNEGNNTISIINTTENIVTGLVHDPESTLNYPQKIVIDSHGLYGYVSNYHNNTISIIDITTDSIIGTINDPDLLISNPFALAIMPNYPFLLVGNYGNNTISVIDLRNHTAIKNVSDPNSTINGPYAINFGRRRLIAYVANHENSTISIINIEILTPEENIEIGIYTSPIEELKSPVDIIISPNGKKAFIVNYYGNLNNTGSISIIDLETNTITGSFADPNSIINHPSIAEEADESLEIGYDTIIVETPSLMYVGNTGNQENGSIAILDMFEEKVISTIHDPYHRCDDPTDIAISPNRRKMLVNNYKNNSVSIIELLDLFPPSSITSQSVSNQFLTQINLTNIISWKAPLFGMTPVAYKIYSDNELTKLLAIIPARKYLKYIDNNVQPKTTYHYWITSVNDQGDQSQPEFIEITTKYKNTFK